MSPNGTEESSFLATTSSTTTYPSRTKNGPTQRSVIVASTLKLWKESDQMERLWSSTTSKDPDWSRPVHTISAMVSSIPSGVWSATTMAPSRGTWRLERRNGSLTSAGITHVKWTILMSWTERMTRSFRRWSRSIVTQRYALPESVERLWKLLLPMCDYET